MCSGGGFPSEAMKMRAVEKEGEWWVEYVICNGREVPGVIESCSGRCLSDALSVSESEDMSAACSERLALRCLLAALRLAIGKAQYPVN